MNTINKIKQAIGFLQLRVAIKQIKEVNYDIPTFEVKALLALDKLGITITGEDFKYITTDLDNWNNILDKIYSVLKDNVWTADIADCDNRANFVSAMVSIVFNLNTCCRAFCEVSDATTGQVKYLHWCNIVVDNNGSLYLFDADNLGMKQKITSKNVVMGNNKYKLTSLRIG